MTTKEQQAIEHEDSYIKAYEDIALLKKDIMRPVRMELEVMKPELYLRHFNVTDTVVCFGSARVREEKDAAAKLKAAQEALSKNPSDKHLQNRVYEAEGLAKLSKYYDEARKFAKIVVQRAGDHILKWIK